MTPRFCHIHNHTEYSLLDGANRIPEMVSKAKELGMEALAITDHGVMFGVMEFYLECEKQGIKPLIGMEAYITADHKSRGRGEEKDSFHQLLIAKDLQGYRNLCKLATIAALQGYYYRPRIDHELLRTYSAGLVGTTTCLGSEVCQLLLKGEYDKAQYLAGQYAEIFGPGNYFVELQNHRIPEQAQIRDGLIKISKQLNLPLVCTNDAHYLCKTDAQPHDVLLCIQTGAQVSDEKRFKFSTDEFYIKSPEEMAEIFGETPEALENTTSIAEMCDVQLGKQQANMPDPDLPEGYSVDQYLREISADLLVKRMPHADERAQERLNFELGIIENTGFGSYFLLVREFAEHARRTGINFGVRGSAAASLVAYSIGITDINPLDYDLTFERFLNPERISMPDIDMDFEDTRRDEMIRYVNEKYGSEHVAQIVTFGTLGAKAAIKDCGRALGYTPQETDRICKTIPTMPGMSIAKAMKEVAEFRSLYQGEDRVKAVVDSAKTVEGLARNCGVHAAGVVISREPLVDHIPLYRSNEGLPVTAFEMGILEKIGLLKMDFLGLSNLTVISKTLANLRSQEFGDAPASLDLTIAPKAEKAAYLLKHGIQSIPLDDPLAYEMLGRAETVGVFQLESGGMTRYVKELKPQNVHELSAMVALYRPGPMENIPAFINVKHGRQEPDYMHDLIKPILMETYGIIVYQEQVQKIAQALAGFSLGKGDLLRRAMGKKDKKAMDSMKVEFLDGCRQREVPEEVGNRVWELLIPFADYAFNKAHAVCYGVLAYQTAFLKANFTVEYMAALLAAYRVKEERVVACIEECRRLKISVLPPSVASSGMDFTIESVSGKSKTNEQTQAIRYGLAAIKGVGDGIAEAIIRSREEEGPFTHFFNFTERLRPFGLSKTALEGLVKAGALDCLCPNRRVLIETLEGALVFADQSNRNRLAGQDSLFGDGDAGSHSSYPPLPTLEPLSRTEILSQEKEVMGIYVSDHPLRGYERLINASISHSCAAVEELDEGKQVKLAGVIAGIRTTITKQKGLKMATLTLEDFTGQASITAFPATYEKLSHLLIKDTVVKITGVVMHRDRPGSGGEKSHEIRLEDIVPMDQLGLDLPASGSATIQVQIAKATKRQVSELAAILRRFPGTAEVQLQVLPANSHLPVFLPISVEPSDELVSSIRKLVPGARVEMSGDTSEYSEDEVALIA
ncbi:MAG: DNA polymerase III subunit alpha [Fimbriimonadaceae bacterium]